MTTEEESDDRAADAAATARRGRRLVFATPELADLAQQAWSQADEMQVLADELLARGLVQQLTVEENADRCSWYADDLPRRDCAFLWLESDVRDWILSQIKTTPPLELRVTGRFPDILYVVYRQNTTIRGATFRGERFELFGVVEQPRLLRDPNERARVRAERSESEAGVSVRRKNGD